MKIKNKIKHQKEISAEVGSVPVNIVNGNPSLSYAYCYFAFADRYFVTLADIDSGYPIINLNEAFHRAMLEKEKTSCSPSPKIQTVRFYFPSSRLQLMVLLIECFSDLFATPSYRLQLQHFFLRPLEDFVLL